MGFCEKKRDGETFLIEIDEARKVTTVTDEKGTRVTIRIDRSGNYDVRLPNGWGSWVTSVESAVDRAMSLCIEARSQPTEEEALKKMVQYVENCR